MQCGSAEIDNRSEEIRLDGISFGKPFPVEEWNPPKKAALYLILRKDDGMIIYVGESGNLEDRDFYLVRKDNLLVFLPADYQHIDEFPSLFLQRSVENKKYTESSITEGSFRSTRRGSIPKP